MATIYCSLGGNCAVTHNIIHYKKRETAYPFDWCSLSVNKLILALFSNFLEFDSLTFKKFSPNHLHIKELLSNRNKGSLIIQNKYKIKFAHELKTEKEIDSFSEKLKERIKRFKLLKSPTFVRLELENLSKEKMESSYLELEGHLKKYFGDDFKIILISKHKYESTYSKWIELDDFSEDWTYPNVKWGNIFV